VNGSSFKNGRILSNGGFRLGLREYKGMYSKLLALKAIITIEKVLEIDQGGSMLVLAD